MTAPRGGVASISPLELKRRLEQGEPLAILDVREDDERAFCRLSTPPGAVDLHVPMGLLSSEVGAILEAVKDRSLVVYCHLGMRSLVAGRWLAARGVDAVFNLEGGIDAWSERVDSSVPRY
jgi:rhodanese-related sulfurtransferase